MSLPPQVRRIPPPPPSSYHQTQLSPFLLFPFPLPSWCIIPRTAKTAAAAAGRRRKKRKSQAHKQQEGEGGRDRIKTLTPCPPPPQQSGQSCGGDLCIFVFYTRYKKGAFPPWGQGEGEGFDNRTYLYLTLFMYDSSLKDLGFYFFI